MLQDGEVAPPPHDLHQSTAKLLCSLAAWSCKPSPLPSLTSPLSHLPTHMCRRVLCVPSRFVLHLKDLRLQRLDSRLQLVPLSLDVPQAASRLAQLCLQLTAAL